ncbi:mevalonate kinase-like protein [Encephalitozoon intestinalis ATCC 50506]|uniref:Mevalonate kinase-like protein n=1 Tax=Encephalitozoon intestinalis (strain ATCC 50506) TaxID=876142 RepID=E0S9T7_ENCIT|nr:mevalonate kinase-like protein [Encephalitozoon intestinalis ATCC 50506]ADM12472.1 mevalonate kinase-like protein [Encephalitozoon intestinalis ATCC 50506]UTX46309.1 phosphomevalonate kinase [Encephalitozoon intestinalis]
MDPKIEFRVPGKVIVNGSYIVLEGETCRAIALKEYMISEAIRMESSKQKIVVEVEGQEKITYYHNRSDLPEDKGKSSYYLLKVVDSFFEVTGIIPKNQIQIRMKAGNGFFVNGPTSEKTGIGSSVCILVSIVYALLKFHQEDLNQIISLKGFERWGRSPVFRGNLESHLGHLSLSKEILNHLLSITYQVHQKTNQGGSGSDAMCCLLGSIYSNREACIPIEKVPRYLILGSFGKSTSTREMLKKIDLSDSKWKSLKDMNSRINKERRNPKKLYIEYLNIIRNISTAIVPEKQYEILIKTNEYDIWGCGISGAGGDDCVWVLTDDYKSVYEYWQKAFAFTFITEVSYKGICLL